MEILILLLNIGYMVSGGLVVSKLCTLFLVPLGMPFINIPTAIGLVIIVRFMTLKINKSDFEEWKKEERLGGVIALIAVTYMTWGIGAIVSLFL